MASVAIVKLCSPLNQRVISLGRLPIASASCFFVIPLSCMSASKRLEISNDNLVCALSAGGISPRSSLNGIFAVFIAHS